MSETLYLLARLADRAVAIPSDQVESVVDLAGTVPVPLAGMGVVGLAALRSRVVTVIDPHAILGGAPAAPRGTRAVVVRREGHWYAVLVDALDDVTACVRDPLPPGTMVGEPWQQIATGLVAPADGTALVIDAVALAGLAGAQPNARAA